MPARPHTPGTSLYLGDAPGIRKKTVALEAVFLSAGSIHPVSLFRRALRRHLRPVPDPDLALTSALRFVESAPSPGAVFHDLLEAPELFGLLLRVCGSSRYFADILIREPGLLHWLAGESLRRPRTREELAEEIKRAGRSCASPSARIDALKGIHRREILRIGVRDLLGYADLQAVTAELSHLAAGVIRAGFATARETLAPAFPAPPNTPYAVIALGKLGGGELNYSSDVDLMVVYGEEGECRDARGRTTTFHEYFVRLVERAVEYLTRASAGGHLYRVDLRLRPDGKAGPLARSLDACLLYYEARGQLWERQMLLKAGPVAGDPVFGSLVLRRLEPFVYPRTMLHHPTEDILRIKAGIEVGAGGEENVKLRPGGIRDIEFTVQALQLLNGGKLPGLRTPNTLDAIDLLEDAGLLSGSEAGVLRSAYVFLRTTEHRLQMMENLQTHTLPPPGRALRALGRRLGFPGEEGFLRAYRLHTARARTVFDAVLTPPGGGDAALAAVVEGHLGEESVRRFLEQRGFRDLRGSARALGIFLRGESLLATGTLDARHREEVRRNAGELLAAVAARRCPDLALANLALLASAPAVGEIVYRELHEPGFRSLIVTLCGSGTRLVRAIAARPALLEEVMAPRTGLPADLSPQAIRTLREFRAAAAYILGPADFDGLARALTAAADEAVRGTVEREAKEMRMNPSSLAVFALGKYGTGEMTLDADLDLLFVAGTVRVAPALERLAGRVVTALSAVSEEGKGYAVDARLRPEGRSAPLVVGAEAYASYLVRRASLWERQSLTRLRPVCGSGRTISRIMEDVRSFVYRRPLPQGWAGDIAAMRRKMETRSRVKPGRVIDIKLGPGGMADIEFLVQMLILGAGPHGEGFHALPVPHVIGEPRWPFPQESSRRMLIDAYRWYREIETLLRLALEMTGSVLPEGEGLETLARCLGFPGAAALADRCQSTMQAVRSIFTAAAAHLDQR